MKKYNNYTKAAAAFLTSFCLAAGMPQITLFAESSSAAYLKNENVYAKLDASGASSDAYVVNTFDLKNASDITDYGAYSSVKNLTNLTVLDNSSDRTSFSADDGKFYYQGTLENTALPWLFSITYQLDGKELSPEELGGKSGSLKISLSLRQNTSVDSIFYDNYVMQISLSLDSEKCTNINAPDATLADAGSNQQLAFTILPGTDADFSIETDVTDFSMSGFSIAAVPYSMNVDTGDLGTDDLTGQFSDLTEAVDLLNEGTKELSDGISALNSGSTSLQNGSSQIKDGLSALSGSSTDLTNASYQIGTALGTISNQLSGADFSSIDSLKELPATLMQLSGALTQIKDGLSQLNNGFAQAYGALDAAVAATSVDALTNEEAAALQSAAAANPSAAAAVNKLMLSYQNLMVLRETYAAVKPAFDAITVSLDPSNASALPAGLDTVITALNTISTSMSSSLEGVDIKSMVGQLQSGLSALTSNYAQFHNGLLSYTEGVSSLSTGYAEYQNGLNTYLDGIKQLDNGSCELAGGMQEFSDGVSDMPDQIQNTIDEMMEQYNSADFDAVSFVDSRNKNINSVQFILSTEGITIPEVKETPEPEVTEGFWDRFLNLFT